MKLLRTLILLTLALTMTATFANAQDFTVQNWAGQAFGGEGSRDGTGKAARFSYASGIAVDAAGNAYVADSGNHTIRKIDPSGVVTTIAGKAGVTGKTDGAGVNARFYSPSGIAVDAAGNLYVADLNNYTIRKIDSSGMITTIAGAAGLDGITNGIGSAARFHFPTSVAVDTAGNIYVTDEFNHTIRKIDSSGMVSTFAGKAGVSGDAGGSTAARFNRPRGVAVDAAGNVYVADYSNQMIRKITPSGFVSTLAGTAGTIGSSNTTGAAEFNYPSRVAVDAGGNVYVGDTQNHTVRKISPSGVVTTPAGYPLILGSADGTGSTAKFYWPRGVAVDGTGNIYVADHGNHTIRKVTSSGVVTTLAGSTGALGGTDGAGTAASFGNPNSVAVDSAGNAYVADSLNHTIRKISSSGVVTTLAGSALVSGISNGTGAAARFYRPKGIAVDGAGIVYVADTSNHTIRKIDLSGAVTTFAGTAGTSGGTDATGTAARFNFPSSLAVDGAGNVYVADSTNHTIRKIDPSGVVTTIAGQAGVSGTTDGPSSVSKFKLPRGITVTNGGTVFVADSSNHTIRMISTAGTVTTIAGQAGVSGSADGTSTAASFDFPTGIDYGIGLPGILYIADTLNHTIRKIELSSNLVTTVSGTAGLSGSTNGVGPNAKFNRPSDIALYTGGALEAKLFVVDSKNNTIRKCGSTLPDEATIALIGLQGQLYQLGTSYNNATSWRWEWLRHPATSTASLSSTTIKNPTFTPDVEDTYIWRVYAEGHSGISTTDVTLTIRGGLPTVSVQNTLQYTAGIGPLDIDAAAIIQDANSLDFDTGNVTLTNTGLVEDDLIVSAVGTVRTNGTSVEYDAGAAFTGSEIVIGILTGNGIAGADLVIIFNANCTPAIAQELLQQLQYQNLQAAPDNTSRLIKITVTDETGLTSSQINLLLYFKSAASTGSGGDDSDSGCAASSPVNMSLLALLGLVGLAAISTRRGIRKQ